MTIYKSKKTKCPQNPGLRISQAAESAGVSKQTVEYYIMLGLVDPIRTSQGRRTSRFFNDETIKRIKIVRQLNQSGYTLRAIREIYLAKPQQS